MKHPKSSYIPSSPRFFRMIQWSTVLTLLLLAAMAWLVPAPLQEAADPSTVPNPVKSAWFLLWIQELVSYGTAMIYPVLVVTGLCALLPWLPGTARREQASWRPAEQLPAVMATLGVLFIILLLTCIAAFLRGENWRLLPFS